MMITISLDYLAGFFDGEGTITGSVENRGATRARKKGWRYTPAIGFVASACQSDPKVLYEFQTQFGGTVSKRIDDRQWGKSASWYWKISGRLQLQRFVEAMEGRLIVKQAHLQLLRQYTHHTVSGHQGRLRLPIEEFQRRTEIVRQIQMLNRPLQRDGRRRLIR